MTVYCDNTKCEYNRDKSCTRHEIYFIQRKCRTCKGGQNGADRKADAAWSEVELSEEKRSVSVGHTENNQVTC